MLSLVLEDNNDIEGMIFGGILPCGERVVLYNDNDPIGIAVFGLSKDNDASVLYRLGIIPSERGKSFGDFFIRAMIYKLSLSGLDIVLSFIDDRFQKFGFVAADNCKMRARNSSIIFPSKCKGEKHD